MHSNLSYIKEFKEDNFYNMNYYDLEFWRVLEYSLYLLYSRPVDPDFGQAPKNFNPILRCAGIGLFDPYMIGGSEARYLGVEGWKAWPEKNGLERTVLLLEKNVDAINNPNFYNKPIVGETKYTRHSLLITNHFMFTKEVISENEIIINFCNMKTKKFKRVHIKNLSIIKDMVFNKQNYDENLIKSNVVDGSNLEIKDENVKEILKRLGFLESEIIYLK